MYLLRRLTGAGGWRCLLVSALLILPVTFPQAALSQSKRPPAKTKTPSSTKTPSTPAANTASPRNPSVGDISGTVTDQDGAVAEGAQIQLTRDNNSAKEEGVSGANGE